MTQAAEFNDITSVGFLEDMLQIPSVSGNEQELSHYLHEFLISNNFQIINSKVGNVVGIKGSGHPIILLASHLDTVSTENPFKATERYFYATGAVDCKSSLATMMFAGGKFPWKESNGTLILAGLVHEETDDIGMNEFLELGLIPDYAVFGEPSTIDRICIGYRGRVWTKLTISTEPGHTASSWDYENAIVLFYDIYQKIQNFTEELNRSKTRYNNLLNENLHHFNELTVTLSTIQAGTASNVLPKSCVGDLDFRIPPWISTDIFVSYLTKYLHELTSNYRDLWKKPVHITFEIVNRTEPVLVNSVNPIVQALRWAIFRESGLKPCMLYKTGTTYTNIMQEYYSKANPEFVCITYGPGDPRLEHTNHERIDLVEYEQCIRIYDKFLAKFLEIYQKHQIKKEPLLTSKILMDFDSSSK